MTTMYDTDAAAQAALDEAGAALGFTITLDAALSRAPLPRTVALGWAQGWTDDRQMLVTVGAWPEGFSVTTSALTRDDDRVSGVHPTIADATRSLVSA